MPPWHHPAPVCSSLLALVPCWRAMSRVVTMFLALACAAGVTVAQTAPNASTALGRAGEYILGFIQYVRWPAEENIDAWKVCVLSEAAGAAYVGLSARGRPLAVRRIVTFEQLKDCQVLDLTDAPVAELRGWLERARRQPVLTLGDGEKFCTAGGVICLRARAGADGAGGFEVNLSAVQEAGLVANAQLLMLGRKRPPAGGPS